MSCMKGVAGNCNIVFMIMSCMKAVSGNCNIVFMIMSCMKAVAGNCNGAIAQMLENYCRMERGREFGSVSSQEQDRFLSVRQNLHDYLEREARRALQGESVAQRKLSDAEMGRDRMIWDKRNPDWAAMYGINSQIGSQQPELHHPKLVSGLVKLKWKAAECSNN